MVRNYYWNYLSDKLEFYLLDARIRGEQILLKLLLVLLSIDYLNAFMYYGDLNYYELVVRIDNGDTGVLLELRSLVVDLKEFIKLLNFIYYEKLFNFIY